MPLTKKEAAVIEAYTGVVMLLGDDRNAVPNSELGAGCEWSRYFKPVPGWDAKRKDVSMGKNRKTLSYFVVKCPKFERG